MRMMTWRKPSEALGWWIFLACLVMYGLSVVMSVLQVEPGEGWVEFIFKPSTDAMIGLGIGGSVPFHENAFWALITANYLHADILHIGMNMLCLLEMMPIVVQQFGRSRTFVIYTLSGIAGSLGSVALGEHYSLGASGCIFGLFGAQVAYGLRVGGEDGWRPAKDNLLWFLLSLGLGLTFFDDISNGGHLGGFAGGFLVALALGAGNKEKHFRATQQGSLALVALTAAGLATGTGLGSWITYKAIEDRAAHVSLLENRRAAETDEKLRQEPDNAAALYSRGYRAYMQQNSQAALDDFARAADLDPSYANLVSKANALYVLQRHGDAVEAYDKAIAASPASIAARIYRADSLQQLGRIDEATAEHRQIIHIQPENGEDFANRGVSFHHLQEWDKAIADYDTALTKDPALVHVYFERANIRLNRDDFAGAVADYSASLQHTPENTQAYGFRAGAFFLLQEWDKAILDYNLAIAAEPTASDLYFGRGLAFIAKNDFQAAIADFDTVIKKTRGNHEAYRFRGAIHSELEQHQKAIDDYTIAITHMPADAQSLNGRAWALFKLDRAAEGLPDVERSLALDPNLAAALDTRGHIFEAMGERDKAIADYRASLEKDPSQETSRQGLRRLGAP